MLSFEVPIVRVRLGNPVAFATGSHSGHSRHLSPTARCLALGHRIVRALEAGEVRGFREAARRLGVSPARISMLVALTFLSPRLQEGLLLGRDEALGFRTYLRIARLETWSAQEAEAHAALHRQSLWGRNSRMGNAPAESKAFSSPNRSRRGPDLAVAAQAPSALDALCPTEIGTAPGSK